MENFITRYRSVTFLVAILFAQVLALAVQVKRSTDNKPTRLLRVWTVSTVTPFEKTIVWFQNRSSYLWHDYLYLRGVRQENRDLKAQIEGFRLQEVRLKEDAEQARRLQLLLGFKEQFISKTMAAQVIGSCGSAQSQCVYIDKGARDGIAPDMAVITADGVVGKVLRAFGSTSQVLLIDDQTSGVGAILEKSRLQGILRGTPSGEVVLEKVMSDEQVEAGEKVLSSGGDLVFPKGMPVGTVTDVTKGAESFLNIHVKPSANLAKLEEVLVITKKEEKEPTVAEGTPVRAIDILTQRLPSVPQQAAMDPNAPPPPTSGLVIAPATGTKSPATGVATSKPQIQNGAAEAGQSPVSSAVKPQNNTNATVTRDVFSPPEAKSPAAPTQKLSGIPGVVAPDTTKRMVGNSPPAAKPQTQPVTPRATQPPPAEDRPH